MMTWSAPRYHEHFIDLMLYIIWCSVHSYVLLEETCLKPSQLESLMELVQTISITFSGYNHICVIVLKMHGKKCALLDFAPVSNGRLPGIGYQPRLLFTDDPKVPFDSRGGKRAFPQLFLQA